MKLSGKSRRYGIPCSNAYLGLVLDGTNDRREYGATSATGNHL
jgi:hypothetical protein